MGSRRKRARRRRQHEIRVLRSKVYELEWSLMRRTVDEAERRMIEYRESTRRLEELERDHVGVV